MENVSKNPLHIRIIDGILSYLFPYLNNVDKNRQKESDFVKNVFEVEYDEQGERYFVYCKITGMSYYIKEEDYEREFSGRKE